MAKGASSFTSCRITMSGIGDRKGLNPGFHDPGSSEAA
jgi:hypothetical protein